MSPPETNASPLTPTSAQPSRQSHGQAQDDAALAVADARLLPPPPPPVLKQSVHWFRNQGLRLHDNPSLIAGLKGATTLRCIFILDPYFAGTSSVGINKWRFLLQCLEDLDCSLRKFNSRLFVIRGQPADALPKLFKEWGTTNLTFQEDPEPFGRERDKNIMAMCKELSINVVARVSHTLYRLQTIIDKCGGKAPLTYQQFQNVIASMDPPPTPEPTITKEHMQGCVTPISDDHDEKYGVPTLEELGFETEGLKPAVWIGGETEALSRLGHHLERKAWVASFGRPKMSPQSLLPSQTGLSPYLRFGCLSTRLFYYQLTDLYRKIKKAVPPLSLHGQLLWREFFYCAATCNPNFDKMEGNNICVQIPWDYNPEAHAKWASGKTGFPWIDAIMTQLREEGWIHHLARHAVACFLTRGDLWISWEEGMKVFEELLLDADWSVNAGMWMWLSCSSFFQQFFHCYCPVRFGRKADPSGDYIRRYLPVLKYFPTEFIHEPWNASDEQQRFAKCIIGKDYPKPMVDHGQASRINLERMKQVYAQLSKYRGSGFGAGSSLLKEQLRLLATVPAGLSPSSIKSVKKSTSLRIQSQVQDGLKLELNETQKACPPPQQHHQQQQQQLQQQKQPQDQLKLQIHKQPPQPILTPQQLPHQMLQLQSHQSHRQQTVQQHPHEVNTQQHQHTLTYHYLQVHHQHQTPPPPYQSVNQTQQTSVPQSVLDSQLMSPPKSLYHTPNSPQSPVCTTLVSEQQIQCVDSHQQVSQLAQSSFLLQSQPLTQLPLYLQSDPYQSLQHSLPSHSQPYQLEAHEEDLSSQQNQQDKQQQ